MNEIKFGALCWNQYTDWPSLLAAGVMADRLGYSSLWTWDHVYPIVGSPAGPMFEGWLTITAWAMATKRVTVGLMVGANTFRHPSLVANPPTIQRPMPILVGGGGERVTLKLVAKYADANNIGGTLEDMTRKDAILREHCEATGRDHREIERTTGRGTPIIRDSREEARRVHAAMFERNGGAAPWQQQPVGTPEDVAAMLIPFAEIGYRHMNFGFPNPYDEESMTRLITEVKPIVERAIAK